MASIPSLLLCSECAIPALLNLEIKHLEAEGPDLHRHKGRPQFFRILDPLVHISAKILYKIHATSLTYVWFCPPPPPVLTSFRNGPRHVTVTTARKDLRIGSYSIHVGNARRELEETLFTTIYEAQCQMAKCGSE